MNVASLELCKELYELSGWKDLEYMHYYFSGHGAGFAYSWSTFEVKPFDKSYPKVPEGVELKANHTPVPPEKRISYFIAPAYDLGYLLRKLPINKAVEFSIAHGWAAIHDDPKSLVLVRREADTPEDAAAEIAIWLFKQGILTKANTTPRTGMGGEGEKDGLT